MVKLPFYRLESLVKSWRLSFIWVFGQSDCFILLTAPEDFPLVVILERFLSCSWVLFNMSAYLVGTFWANFICCWFKKKYMFLYWNKCNYMIYRTLICVHTGCLLHTHRGWQYYFDIKPYLIVMPSTNMLHMWTCEIEICKVKLLKKC